MVRLTDEQRETCAQYVPLAHKLAARYVQSKGLRASAAEDVASAFLFALPLVVAEYDPTRGTSITTHIQYRLACRALDLMRKENGRPGKLSHRMRAATASLDYCLWTDPDSGRAMTVGDTVPDARAARPAAEVEFADLCAALRKHVVSRELYLLVQTYIVGRTLADVGREFGVAETRASQMRGRAVEKLLAAGALEGQ